MSDRFNDKHLLWWVFKAIDECEFVSRDDLLDETTWKIAVEAPDWVITAIREKYADFY